MSDELFRRHDEGVSPKAQSQGHGCRARGNGMDYQTQCDGPDKQVPPKAR